VVPRTTYGAFPSNQPFKDDGELWMMLFSDPGEVIAEKDAFDRAVVTRIVRGKTTSYCMQMAWLLILFLTWGTNCGKRGPTMVPWMVRPDQVKCHTGSEETTYSSYNRSGGLIIGGPVVAWQITHAYRE